MFHEPAHFSKNDLVKAIFGGFLFGMTFLFKGEMISYAKVMPMENVFAVLGFTFLVVTAEIYLLSYRYVRHKRKRPFHEFWAKRFFSILVSCFVMLYIIIYLYGINNILTDVETFKLACIIFLPSAAAGAAVEMLKRP